MIRRILLTCRGEIAHRFIRTTQRLGIETIVVFEADEKTAPFVTAATYRELTDIGNPYSSSEYLISIAKKYGADAVAAGYGPLAESADFAQLCTDAGIIFIGPNASALRLVGDKIQARNLAISAGIPVIPGAGVASLIKAQEFAEQIGYPVLLKAANGGGGRGIRLAENPEMLARIWKEVEHESFAAFGTTNLYIERFLGQDIRHVEVQILSDTAGNTIAVGDRDCSIQRRRQKIVEEAPAPRIEETLRSLIQAAAIKFAQVAGYASAGTVEFLMDPHGGYYFIEMNGRIQVEHPVTEAVTGIDIIEAMFTIANGKSLPDDILNANIYGHAIEFRICSEDPFHDFIPSGGMVTACDVPQGAGIRVDAGISAGNIQPSRYDSLCLKLIVWGRNREEAILRSRVAFNELCIAGFPTNIPFHNWLLKNMEFLSGNYNLSLTENYKHELPNETTIHEVAVAAALREYLSIPDNTVDSSLSSSRWSLINERRGFHG
jgi:acetyl-CoA carboxylase biotin carboxylase subunit